MRPSNFRLAIIFALLAIGGCGPSVQLPELPSVSTDKMLPDVAAQLTSARAAVDKKPRSHQTNGQYGLVLATYGRDDAADIALRRARLLSPRTAEWDFFHSFVLRRKGDFDNALEAINDGLSVRKNHVDLLVKRGELHFDLGQFDLAEKDLRSALEQNPTYPLAQYYLGRIHVARKNYDKAAERFEKMLDDNINAREGYFPLASVYTLQGNTDKAALNRAKSERAGDQPHLVRAAEHYRKGQVQAAINELELAREKNPDKVDIHAHLVRFYGQMGNLEKSEFHFDIANKIDPNFSQLHDNMGFAYQSAKRYAEAAKAYRKAAEVTPNDAGVHAELGFALSRLDQLEEATQHFTRSLELQPSNRDLRFIFGDTLLRMRRYADATEMLSSALTPVDHKTIAVNRILARAHALSGNHAAAIESLEDAIALAKEYGTEAMIADLVADIDRVEHAKRNAE